MVAGEKVEGVKYTLVVTKCHRDVPYSLENGRIATITVIPSCAVGWAYTYGALLHKLYKYPNMLYIRS